MRLAAPAVPSVASVSGIHVGPFRVSGCNDHLYARKGGVGLSGCVVL